MKKILFLTAIAGLMIVGCKKDNCCLPSVLSASKSVLNLSGDFDSQIFTLECPIQWSLLNPGNLPSWLHIKDNQYSGKGMVTITVEVDPNDEGLRDYLLTFMASNGDQIKISVKQSAEYADFMNNDLQRWEKGDNVQKNADQSETVFGVFKNGLPTLIPGKYTIGREARDGSWFEYLGFNGPPVAGKQDGWIITEDDINPRVLNSFEILKIQIGTPPTHDMLWIVFQESPGLPERRIVQEAF